MWEFLASPSDAEVALLTAAAFLGTLGLVRLIQRVREIGS